MIAFVDELEQKVSCLYMATYEQQHIKIST